MTTVPKRPPASPHSCSRSRSPAAPACGEEAKDGDKHEQRDHHCECGARSRTHSPITGSWPVPIGNPVIARRLAAGRVAAIFSQIDDDGDRRADADPEKLIPVEEWDSPHFRRYGGVRRDPESSDVGDDEQPRYRATPTVCAASCWSLLRRSCWPLCRVGSSGKHRQQAGAGKRISPWQPRGRAVVRGMSRDLAAGRTSGVGTELAITMPIGAAASRASCRKISAVLARSRPPGSRRNALALRDRRSSTPRLSRRQRSAR